MNIKLHKTARTTPAVRAEIAASTEVSVWARHLELTGTSPEHRVHDGRGGEGLYRGGGQPTPLAAARRLGGVHWPSHPTPALSVQTTARRRDLWGLKRLAASCGAAIPRSDC
jgi:hypothetical protein